jgi:hypothetical protein
VGALDTWRRYKLPLTLWTDHQANVTNNELLPYWCGLDPRDVLEQTVRTAEILDGINADLSPAEVEAVAAKRYRVLERALHRAEHLDEVDRAIAG